MALETVAGLAARIRNFFGRRSEVVRFWFGQIVHPVAEVGPLMASFGIVTDGPNNAQIAEVVVPQGKRWFVYWAHANGSLGTLRLYLAKGSGSGTGSDTDMDKVMVATGSGNIFEWVGSYLEAGDSIMAFTTETTSPVIRLKVWRSEFDA